jgi:hypothetical protein
VAPAHTFALSSKVSSPVLVALQAMDLEWLDARIAEPQVAHALAAVRVPRSSSKTGQVAAATPKLAAATFRRANLE